MAFIGKITEKQKMNKPYVQEDYGRQAVALFSCFNLHSKVEGKKVKLRNFYNLIYRFL